MLCALWTAATVQVYDNAMRVYRNRLFLWLLVTSLALLPLRTEFAVPVCDIHDHNSHGVQLDAMQGMPAHHAHAVGMMGQTVALVSQDSTQTRACCCCDDNDTHCVSSCEMGLHATTIVHITPVLASNFQALPLVETSDILHTRTLTPPSRPPLDTRI
jgi:hypothetical protein